MTLFEISKKMRHENIVFIIGAARSGTSILYRTLQKHHSFKPLRENLSESHIINYSNRSFLLKNNSPTTLFEYMLNDKEEYKNFTASIKVIKWLHNFSNFSLNRKLSNRYPLFWRLNLNHLLLRSYFYYAKKVRACDRLIEKTPSLCMHIGKLNLTFPNCKMLYIFRHPVDIFSSYKKLVHKNKEATWADQSIEDFCCNYRNNYSIISMEEIRRKETLISIKYEEFTHDTEKTCDRIFSFLGEPFDKSVLIEKRPDLNRWKPDPHLFGNITTKSKNWEDYISQSDAQFIENSLEDILEKLNYSRYTRC